MSMRRLEFDANDTGANIGTARPTKRRNGGEETS